MQQSFLILIFLTLGFLSCKKIENARPLCDAQDVVIPQDTSFLSTPFVIPTQLIEDKINRAIKQDLVNDDDFENMDKTGKKDKIKMKVTRLGDIQVTWKNNEATYQAPLLVLVQRRIVDKKVIPMPKSLALKTEFSLRLVFKTKVDINEKWEIVPDTKFASFEWLSDVKTMGGLISIKKIIERRLRNQMPDVVANLNHNIQKNVHLDRAITKIWKKVQKPIIINRKQQLVWLKIKPIQFELGNITTEGGNLMVEGRLSATTETLLGDNPDYSVDSILPPLVKRKMLPNLAYVYMLSDISYEDINTVINKKLAGEVFKISGRRIKIKSAEVWGCSPNLILHVSVSGAVKGDIYFKGCPKYEPDSQRVIIENFDFEVKTEETLLASADWLLHGTFKDQMQSALSLPLAEKTAKIPEAIMQGIERGKAGQKMDLFIQDWDFKPQQIWVREDGIAALVIVNAKVRLEIEHI